MKSAKLLLITSILTIFIGVFSFFYFFVNLNKSEFISIIHLIISIVSPFSILLFSLLIVKNREESILTPSNKFAAKLKPISLLIIIIYSLGICMNIFPFFKDSISVTPFLWFLVPTILNNIFIIILFIALNKNGENENPNHFKYIKRLLIFLIITFFLIIGKDIYIIIRGFFVLFYNPIFIFLFVIPMLSSIAFIWFSFELMMSLNQLIKNPDNGDMKIKNGNLNNINSIDEYIKND
jgi:hypothetical protein